ncbi:related to Non-classical export protein 2 [Saccharomycodes ludwigii]|uniref:Related to Non-classical export protein 2 n=1 Tax=Saccharomycodes ludwigii TaxID=36035 RepID=A0A376BAD2_9ASCO|nr:hypothetical protein SCDLUD_002376 [Saccharomycodes ludwigii]KAH3900916.1 hypothetical protein SCDLUD_002376 [Saccharomycodes ludwigii]SSD61539.1 related to Non-classical export protein 2 [Saccharomycodes ludwigii]
MLSIVDNSLRVVNFMFLVIILGLIGSLIATSESGNHSPRVNFCIFTAAFGLLFDSFYAILANFFTAFAWPIILVVLDFLNFVFTFAAATALAVGTRTHSCTNQSYLDSNSIMQGSTDRCRKAQASTAFLYFSFFIFLVKLIMDLISLVTTGAFGSFGGGLGRKRTTAPVGGIPTGGVPTTSGGPTISQV